jgi:hypothetical protein
VTSLEAANGLLTATNQSRYTRHSWERQHWTGGQAVSAGHLHIVSSRVTDVSLRWSRSRRWHTRGQGARVVTFSIRTDVCECWGGEDWFYSRCRLTNTYRLPLNLRTRAYLTSCSLCNGRCREGRSSVRHITYDTGNLIYWESLSYILTWFLYALSELNDCVNHMILSIGTT